jgi:hypothetical protein
MGKPLIKNPKNLSYLVKKTAANCAITLVKTAQPCMQTNPAQKTLLKALNFDITLDSIQDLE